MYVVHPLGSWRNIELKLKLLDENAHSETTTTITVNCTRMFASNHRNQVYFVDKFLVNGYVNNNNKKLSDNEARTQRFQCFCLFPLNFASANTSNKKKAKK